jgi:lipopolysaccharide export system permease protein
LKIIPKYVLKHFLPILALATVSFVGIYLVVDFFERVDKMVDNHFSIKEIYAYFLFKIPLILTLGVPMAAILAAIISLGILKRNRELIAMETAGIAPRYYITPIAVAALLLALAHFSLAEFVARPLNKKLDETWAVRIEHSKPALWMNLENMWFRDENTIYQIRLYERAKNIMHIASIFFLDSKFRLAKRIDARSITWTNPGWLAEDGLIVTFQNGDNGETDQQWFDRKPLDLRAKPSDFKAGETLPHDLSWTELHRYVQKIEGEGFSATPYRVDLHMRLASPVATLILTMLGVLIALRQGIHEGIAAGVGVSLIVAFAFVAVSNVGSSLASAGSLPASLGVWAGNIIFAALFCYFWIKVVSTHR